MHLAQIYVPDLNFTIRDALAAVDLAAGAKHMSF
jgi:hypothetical protein